MATLVLGEGADDGAGLAPVMSELKRHGHEIMTTATADRNTIVSARQKGLDVPEHELLV